MHPFNFPQPELDETLHSLLIRAHRLSGFSNFRTFTEAILGRPSDGRGWSWRYKKVGRYLDSCKITAWAILQGTLLLPYLMPFMSPEAARLGQNRLDGGHRTGDDGVLPAWHINNSRPLRYCPLCARQQQKRLGISVWLRSHQLDGVNVCWRHAVSLVDVTQHRISPLLPHEFPNQTIRYEFNKFDLWLAKQTRVLLQTSHGPTSSEIIKTTYRAQAARLGYKKTPSIDYFLIASHLLKRFDRRFIERIFGSSDIERVTKMVHRTITASTIGIRPTNHILCIEVLFGEQHNFFLAIRKHTDKDSVEEKKTPEDQRNQLATTLIHKKIFLEVLATHRREVMSELNRNFPLTHQWIVTHALHWSRRRLSNASLN